MQNGNQNKPDFTKEERAYALLQLGYPVPLAAYDEQLAVEGFYSRVQKQRSDAALDAFEEKHPYQSNPELAAFRELERIGVLTEADFYSPDKAKRCPRWIDVNDRSKGEKSTCTSYTDDLKQQRTENNQNTDRRGSREPGVSPRGIQSTGMANSDKDTGKSYFLGAAVVTFDPHPGHTRVVAEDLIELVIPKRLDIVLGEQAILQNFFWT